jgi:hypothetical protein
VGRWRLLALRIAAGLFAFVFWLPSLALTDLALGLIPAGSETASHRAGDLAYGIIGAVLVAPAFASQVRRPERKVAPLQQIALVALALAIAATLAGEYVGLAGAVVVLVPLALVAGLHPGQRDVFRPPRRTNVPLLVLALAAAVAALPYAWEMGANGRADLPPEDSFAYVPSLWSAAAGMAVATVLIALLAALRPRGWRVPAWCVAVAALLFGIGSLINPDIAASGGRAWGTAAIIWSVAWIATAVRDPAVHDPSEAREGSS